MPHLFSPTFLPGGGFLFSIHFLHPFLNFSARFPQVMGKGPRIWRWSNVATATPKYHIDRCVPWQDRWAPPENEQLMVNAPENRQVIPEMNQLPNINFQGRTVSFRGTYTVDVWWLADLPKFLSKGDQLETTGIHSSENVKIFAYPHWWFGVLVGLGFESEHPPFHKDPGFIFGESRLQNR